MVIDLHAKNQVNIYKRLGKKSGKLILTDWLTDGRTDWWTDRRTEGKPKAPFGLAGRGLTRSVTESTLTETGNLPKLFYVQ